MKINNEIGIFNISKETKLYKRRLPIIQFIRGVASILVVIYHFKHVLIANDAFKQVIDLLFSNGAAGVDIFFVLSGFVMVYSNNDLPEMDKSRKAYRFIVKRIMKIVPLYLFFTLLYLFVLIFNKDIIFDLNTTKILIKSLLFIPVASSDAPHFGYPILSVGWSLNFELYFYIIFCLSFFWGRWQYIFILTYFICTLLLPVAIFNKSFTFDCKITHFDNTYFNFITNPIIWEFVYGMIIGLIYKNTNQSELRSKRYFWIGFLFTTFGTWQLLSGFWGGHGPINWGIASILFVSTGVFIWGRGGVNRHFNFIGDISYSLYLVHIPVLTLMNMVLKLTGLGFFTTGFSYLFLLISLSLILAYHCHNLIENKIYQKLVKLFLV